VSDASTAWSVSGDPAGPATISSSYTSDTDSRTLGQTTRTPEAGVDLFVVLR
jgi:hypothetical protein